MSTLDLDKMQGAWRQHSQRVEASLQLDVEGVRNRLKLGTASAFKRHLLWLTSEIVFGGATLLALLAFMISERTDVLYVAASVPLLALALFAFTTDIRHWRILSRLNLSAPIIQVRGVLDGVRARRLLVAKWIALSACLLWLPLIAVLCKAAFAWDLLRGLPVSVLMVNLALGILLIPIGMRVFGWFTERFEDAPAFQRFIENASGTSFSAARSNFELEADFESGLANSEAHSVLTHVEQSQWSVQAIEPLRHLRRSALGGILFWALLVAAPATFNVLHGGNAHALIPGIFLHLFFVVQLVAAIIHRQLLGNLGATSAQPLTPQIQSLKQMAYWRGNVARISIVLTPLLVLALLQVCATVFFAIDLYQATATALAMAAIGSACVLSAVLFLRWRATLTRFAPALSNAATFSAIDWTDKLLALLERNSA